MKDFEDLVIFFWKAEGSFTKAEASETFSTECQNHKINSNLIEQLFSDLELLGAAEQIENPQHMNIYHVCKILGLPLDEQPNSPTPSYTGTFWATTEILPTPVPPHALNTTAYRLGS